MTDTGRCLNKTSMEAGQRPSFSCPGTNYQNVILAEAGIHLAFGNEITAKNVRIFVTETRIAQFRLKYVRLAGNIKFP
jgi:hypothetical protein